ncbi:MAG: iron chelate uptake ABC transporter family permease subunit, partial [Oscillospiraceae bacterium]|nr:iron chelate uptake ABC transporter family permease subunit [Oscillospiraceae bacterium]
ILFFILTFSLCATMLLLGNTIYPVQTMVNVLLGEQIKGASFAILTLRLPRMFAGLLAGAAFGMAGSAFQTMLRNPLASPYIIGVTSRSSVAAVFCIIVLKASGPIVSIASVFSGLVVAGIIYLLSKCGSFSGGKLILIGIGIQAMLNAIISFIMIKAPQYDIPAAVRWLSGSLNGVQISEIKWLLAAMAVFGSCIAFLGRHLKILELGEQSAVILGINADKLRLAIVLSSVFLIAFSSAVTGPIAFIAFLSGPIAKKIAGTGMPNEIPSAFVGAALTLGADLIGQFAFSIRFPVGIITGILGAPYLIFLLIRINRTGGSL